MGPAFKVLPCFLQHGLAAPKEDLITGNYITELVFVLIQCLRSIRAAFCSEGKEQEKAAEESLEALKNLEEELSGKEFFGGESGGFLDLVVGWIPHWLPVLEEVGGYKLLDAESFPSPHAWCNRFLNTPFIKEKLPPSERLFVYYTNVRKEELNK